MILFIFLALQSLCLDYVKFLINPEDLLKPPDANTVKNNPTIGIITLRGSEELGSQYTTSQVIFSYAADFAFSGGSSVIPIQPILTAANLDLLSKVNGIIIQDGHTQIFHKDGQLTEYGSNVTTLIELVKGAGIPVLGIGNGFDLLFKSAFKEAQFTNVNVINKFTKLAFAKDVQPKIFSYAEPEVLQTLTNKEMGFLNATLMISVNQFNLLSLNNNDNMITVTTEINKERYVIGFENAIFPIFGLKFHPEMGNCLYSTDIDDAMHNPETIGFSQAIINYFTIQIKKNNRTLPSATLSANDIVNYNTVYNPIQGQAYIIPNN